MVLYVALSLGSWIIPRLPKWLVRAMAQGAGAIGYVVAKGPRHNIQDNLAVVMRMPSSSATVRWNALLAFQNNARNWCDTLRLEATSRRDIESIVNVEGWERLQRCLTLGNGVILLGLHLGNFDIVGQIVAARGLTMTVPVEEMEPAALFRRIQTLRQSLGINTVPLSAGPRPLLAALKRNEIVGILCDRNTSDSGVAVRFFGRTAIVSKGPAWLASLSDAPVLMGVGIRQSDDRFRGFVSGPLPIKRSGNRREDHRANAQTVISAAESWIGQYPDQWLMFANVWPDDPSTVSDVRRDISTVAEG